eukprot:9479607-Pyramimonas_sp.AAC.1
MSPVHCCLGRPWRLLSGAQFLGPRLASHTRCLTNEVSLWEAVVLYRCTWRSLRIADRGLEPASPAHRRWIRSTNKT